MKVHPRTAGLFVTMDPDWRKKIFHGGLLLLVAPPFGWPAVLGYRAALVERLFGSDAAPLPSWKGEHARHFVTGLKAMGVLFGYLLPIYLALGALLLERGYTPHLPALAVCAFFLVFPIFSTLSLPVACVLLTYATKPALLSTGELGAFLAAYAAAVFLLPAGFLRVSQTGRFLSAFRLTKTIPFTLRHLRSYLAAWWYSGLMSLAGHFAIPLSPWGVVWCYLGIIFLFNELLLEESGGPEPCGMAKALSDERFSTGAGLGLHHLDDATGRRVAVLDFGPFSAPMPALRRRRR